jgi:hypothetical protein
MQMIFSTFLIGALMVTLARATTLSPLAAALRDQKQQRCRGYSEPWIDAEEERQWSQELRGIRLRVGGQIKKRRCAKGLRLDLVHCLCAALEHSAHFSGNARVCCSDVSNVTAVLQLDANARLMERKGWGGWGGATSKSDCHSDIHISWTHPHRRRRETHSERGERGGYIESRRVTRERGEATHTEKERRREGGTVKTQLKNNRTTLKIQ